MNRTQLILGGLLLAQLLLIVVIRAPFSGASADGGERPLFATLSEATPSRIEILDKEDDRLELFREGEAWSVESRDGFPADAAKIENLIRDLEAIRVRRPVVSSGRYHETFNVTADEPEGRLRVWSEGGDEPEVDLILGSSSNYRTTHARLADEDAVYEIRGLAPFDLRPRRQAWIRKDLLEVGADEVVGFSLTNGNGRFEMQKQENAWTVSLPEIGEAREPDGAKIDALVRALTSIRLDDAAEGGDTAGQGLEAPLATLVLHLAGAGPPKTLKVGAAVEGEDTKLYIASSDLDAAGITWKSSVTRLLDATLDELLKDREDAPEDPADG